MLFAEHQGRHTKNARTDTLSDLNRSVSFQLRHQIQITAIIITMSHVIVEYSTGMHHTIVKTNYPV